MKRIESSQRDVHRSQFVCLLFDAQMISNSKIPDLNKDFNKKLQTFLRNIFWQCPASTLAQATRWNENPLVDLNAHLLCSNSWLEQDGYLCTPGKLSKASNRNQPLPENSTLVAPSGISKAQSNPQVVIASRLGHEKSPQHEEEEKHVMTYKGQKSLLCINAKVRLALDIHRA